MPFDTKPVFRTVTSRAATRASPKPTFKREADRYIWPVIKEMLAARRRAGLTQEASTTPW